MRQTGTLQESKAEGALFASFRELKGGKGRDRSATGKYFLQITYPTPTSIKREEKAPSLNTKQQHYQ